MGGNEQDTHVSTTGIYEQRRDSLAARLSQSPAATQAAYEEIPHHKSFTREESPFTDIRLSDPEKVSDHTEYKLIVYSRDRKSCYTQQRRYQHFEWLYRQLVTKFPGAIVPPLPSKRIFGRFDQDFVEARRHLLEVFIKKVNLHPILMGSEDFRTFVLSVRPEDVSSKEGKGIMQLVGGVFSENTSIARRSVLFTHTHTPFFV